MSVVWKLPLNLKSDGEIEVPKGAMVLCANYDGEQRLCIWAEIPDTDAETVKRCFRVFGTGHTMPMVELRYIGTVFAHGGMFVLHVYEEPRP